MKVILYIALCSFFFNSCKQQVTETQSTQATPVLNGSCNIGKWSSSKLPLALKISPELVQDFNDSGIGGTNSIELMARVWNNAVPSIPLFNVPLGTAASNGSSTLSGFHDNELGIYKSDSWFSNVSPNALAITQFYGTVTSDGSLGTYIDLTHADIILNYHNFTSADLTYTGSAFDYDIPTIVLHEMGHFLGLCHENSATSVMAPYYFTTQRTLKAFDTSKISALYLNNQNYAFSAFTAASNNINALTTPIGSTVKGIVELNSNGICKHYINGKLIFQHIQR
jgi:Matrixin